MIIWFRLFSLNISCDFNFFVKVTRNTERVSTWDCPFGALRLVVNYLTLMTLKPKPSRLLEYLPLAYKVTDYCLDRFSEFGEKVK
jgi:hypothetical protein